MSSLDEQKKRFDAMTERAGEKHKRNMAAARAALGWDPATLPPPNLDDARPIREQMDEYEDWMEQRIRRWRNESPLVTFGETLAAGTAHRYTAAEPLDQGSLNILVDIDRLLLQDFGLNRYLSSRTFTSPPIFCRSQDEFVNALARGMELGFADTRALLDKTRDQKINLEAAYLPNLGCLVNASCFPELQTDAPQFGQGSEVKLHKPIMRVILQAKWGWGFILEFTSSGKGLWQQGLYAARLCRQLGMVPERLTGALSRLDVLEYSLMPVIQAWLAWIWQYLDEKGPGQGSEAYLNRSRYTFRMSMELLKRVGRVLNLDIIGKSFDTVDLIGFIFIQFLRAPERVDEWMRQLIDAGGSDTPFSDFVNQAREYLAWSAVKTLEASFGPVCMPYAMAIIFHLPEKLFTCELDALRKLLRTQPGVNVADRLALLTQLDACVSYNPHGLLLSAREKLQLDAPEVFYKIAAV